MYQCARVETARARRMPCGPARAAPCCLCRSTTASPSDRKRSTLREKCGCCGIPDGPDASFVSLRVRVEALGPDHELRNAKVGAVVAKRRDAIGVRARTAIDTIAGGDVPFHDRGESWIEIRATFGEPAELERAPDLHPLRDVDRREERLQSGRAMGA